MDFIGNNLPDKRASVVCLKGTHTVYHVFFFTMLVKSLFPLELTFFKKLQGLHTIRRFITIFVILSL